MFINEITSDDSNMLILASKYVASHILYFRIGKY